MHLSDDVVVTLIVRRRLREGETEVRTSGSSDALGAWDGARGAAMKQRGDVHACAVRLRVGETHSFKFVTVDARGEIVTWTPGEAMTLETPRRCASAEVWCEWPSDDARMTIKESITLEMSASDNRVETGGAWLAYGSGDVEHANVGEDDADGEDGGQTSVAVSSDEGEDEEDDDDGVAAMGTVTIDEDEINVDDFDDVGMTIEKRAHFSSDESMDEGEYAYRPQDHVDEMLGASNGLHTELVFNAANEEDFGVRIAILEEGELVELWHEHGTEPGKGMRVGDIYLGTVSKVISGMQGVLVDLTGKGPPYALMQKGIEKPALAWRLKGSASAASDETSRQADNRNEARNGGWWEGNKWKSDEDATQTDVAPGSANEPLRSYTRRLAAKGTAGGSAWRGAGGRSIRSSTPKSPGDSSRWVKWTPDLTPDECTVDVNGNNESDVQDEGDDDSDGSGGDVVTEKMTRRRLREECYSMWQPGQPVVVQVTRLGSGYKGPRVTARPTLPGRNVVLCPDGEGVYVSRKLMGHARKYVKDVGLTVCPEGSALIMRTEAAGVNKDTLRLDIGCLADDWSKIVTESEGVVYAANESFTTPHPRRLLQAASREQVLVRDLFGERVSKLTVDTPESYKIIVDDLMRSGASQAIIDRVVLHEASESVFESLGVDADIESMVGTERVFLGPELSGAHIVIQHTEALTAIDVNAGRTAMEAGEDGEAIALRVNMAAAALVARVLRLRDIGGLVMVDLIDMHADDARREVEKAFQAAAARDRAQVVFVPISALGVMEIARERLQTHALGAAAVIANEKGMPIASLADSKFMGDKSHQKKVRSVRGPRPPPWAAGRGRGGRGRGGRTERKPFRD